MNLLWCCVAAAFTLASAIPVNVELTVRQVQSILRQNPQLPRLSRDDIIQLLDDIRAEDARNSREVPAPPVSNEESVNAEKDRLANKPEADETHEMDQLEQAEVEVRDNEIPYQKPGFFENDLNSMVEVTTKSNDASVMVVLPYTPRDGSSLQELYTKPPRTKLVRASTLTTETTEKMKVASSDKMLETFATNAKIASEARKQIYPDLEDFLRTHDLSGVPGDDHFLLPLEGFKPLPPAKVDDNVELPENIILTYDLASSKPSKNDKLSPSRVLYDPLQPEYPFELATAESESKQVAFPLDLPIKSYESLDLLADQIKVLPLQGGPNPANEDSFSTGSDVGKRQTAAPTEANDDELTKKPTTAAPAEETVQKDVVTDLDNSTSNKNADSEPVITDNFESSAADAGASISDLEDSFGGAVPSEPGDSMLPPPKKNGFYWMLDWNSFLEVGDGDTKVNIRFEPKLGDPQMFLPVSVP